MISWYYTTAFLTAKAAISQELWSCDLRWLVHRDMQLWSLPCFTDEGRSLIQKKKAKRRSATKPGFWYCVNASRSRQCSLTCTSNTRHRNKQASSRLKFHRSVAILQLLARQLGSNVSCLINEWLKWTFQQWLHIFLTTNRWRKFNKTFPKISFNNLT